MDWAQLFAAILTSSAFTGVVTIVVKGVFDRRKANAEAGVTEVGGAVRLNDQMLKALEEMREFYENRIRAIQLDATNQIASARADAAQSVARALNDVSTARGEATESRRAAEAAEARAEAAEARFRAVARELWKPDPDLMRLRALIDDGGGRNGVAPLGAPRV